MGLFGRHLDAAVSFNMLEFLVTGGFKRYTESRATAGIAFWACEIRSFNS